MIATIAILAEKLLQTTFFYFYFADWMGDVKITVRRYGCYKLDNVNNFLDTSIF